MVFLSFLGMGSGALAKERLGVSEIGLDGLQREGAAVAVEGSRLAVGVEARGLGEGEDVLVVAGRGAEQSVVGRREKRLLQRSQLPRAGQLGEDGAQGLVAPEWGPPALLAQAGEERVGGLDAAGLVEGGDLCEERIGEALDLGRGGAEERDGLDVGPARGGERAVQLDAALAVGAGAQQIAQALADAAQARDQAVAAPGRAPSPPRGLPARGRA